MEHKSQSGDGDVPRETEGGVWDVCSARPGALPDGLVRLGKSLCGIVGPAKFHLKLPGKSGGGSMFQERNVLPP